MQIGKTLHTLLTTEAAIQTVEHDEDGYWIYLNPDWHVGDDELSHTYHEATVRELVAAYKSNAPIRVTCDCGRNWLAHRADCALRR